MSQVLGVYGKAYFIDLSVIDVVYLSTLSVSSGILSVRGPVYW